MTQVIRIALSLFLAVSVLASLSDPADAQLFRRLRNNIQSNIQANNAQARQAIRSQSPLGLNGATGQPYQVAPRPQGQYGQPLTPYARTTPQQRQQQIATPTPTPSVAGATNVAKPATTVRVVTYFDPRTGRTYQRRFVVPENGPATTAQAAQANGNVRASNSQVSTDANRSGENTIQGSVEPLTANASNRFNIPPIRSTQPATGEGQSVVQNDILPTLAGPASPSTATASNNNVIVDRQVAPAAASSSQIGQPTLSSSVNSGSDIVAYSVLDRGDGELDSASPEIGIEMSAPVDNDGVLPTADATPADDFDIEIEAPDDVEAFFGPSN